MTKKHRRKKSGKYRVDSTKETQVVHLQETGSGRYNVHVPEPASLAEIKSTKDLVSREERRKPKIIEHKAYEIGEKSSSASQQAVNSKNVSESSNVQSSFSDLLSLTCSPEKSVNLSNTLKRKNAVVTPDKNKQKKQKTTEKESPKSQVLNVSGYHEPVTATSRFDLDDVTPDKNKQKKQKTTEKESSKSQVLNVSGYHEPVTATSSFDLNDVTPGKNKQKKQRTTEKESRKSQVLNVSGYHEPVTATSSFDLNDVTPDKNKQKKLKTMEKESSKSQVLNVSGYHEPVTATISVDLDEILGSSAQKLISDVYSKKSVDFKTATKSYPLLSKGAEEQSSGRLAEFRGFNCVSYGTWNKVCKELKKEGKKYNSGRFSQEENDQLRKNWEKLTKSCPFEQPHALLMKNHFPDLRNDIEIYTKDTNFYVRLGKNINRPLYNVYIRARKMFIPGNDKGRYTEEEVEMLKRQHHEYGSQWQKIGQLMDRSGQSLNDKFKRLKTTTVLGRWSPEEDAQLREAVKTAVTDNTDDEEAYFNFPWTEIARGVPTRNAKQCRDHWVNMLAFGNEGKNKFGKEDNIRLIHEIMAMNVSHESEINWIELKSKFDISSPQLLQHKWYLLRVKVPDFQNSSLREVLEYLEREVVPEMNVILQKKQEDDMTTISRTSSETSSKRKIQHEEDGDER